MNSEVIRYGVVVIALLAIELAYFRIAHRFQIVDKPNNRSSHAREVIRGGGVIFIAAVLLWFVKSGYMWPWFVLGALLIAIISFMDDMISLNPFLRFLVQACAVLLMFAQLWPIHWPVYLLILALIVCVGTLNAFNFMDGINGITGIYALVCLTTFGYVQLSRVPFTDLALLVVVSLSVLIFLFFNFRVHARSFAGDVGSVTIAFVLIFFLLQLIHMTHNLLWPLLFLVYGTDSIITIVFRLRKRENIFTPHRTHVFQYLSNEMSIPHRTVSLLYGGVQALINVIIIESLYARQHLLPIVVAVAFVVVYLVIRMVVIRQINSMDHVQLH